MNIVLMGYMGSGKSMIGRRLASKINFKYLDLDDYIEEKENKSVKEIFQDHGEIYFRKCESKYLREILDHNDDIILSLGGGTPCFSGNIEFITENQNTKGVYLQTSLDELTRRLFVERNKRPLIAHIDTQEELKDFIRKHLCERSFYYNQAKHKVNTDQKDADQIVDEIVTSLF